MDILVLTKDYAKIDRGHGVETLSREEYDALVAPETMDPDPAPEAETKADDAPPNDKAVRASRKK